MFSDDDDDYADEWGNHEPLVVPIHTIYKKRKGRKREPKGSFTDFLDRQAHLRATHPFVIFIEKYLSTQDEPKAESPSPAPLKESEVFEQTCPVAFIELLDALHDFVLLTDNYLFEEAFEAVGKFLKRLQTNSVPANCPWYRFIVELQMVAFCDKNYHSTNFLPKKSLFGFGKVFDLRRLYATTHSNLLQLREEFNESTNMRTIIEDLLLYVSGRTEMVRIYHGIIASRPITWKAYSDSVTDVISNLRQLQFMEAEEATEELLVVPDSETPSPVPRRPRRIIKKVIRKFSGEDDDLPENPDRPDRFNPRKYREPYIPKLTFNIIYPTYGKKKVIKIPAVPDEFLDYRMAEKFFVALKREATEKAALEENKAKREKDQEDIRLPKLVFKSLIRMFTRELEVIQHIFECQDALSKCDLFTSISMLHSIRNEVSDMLSQIEGVKDKVLEQLPHLKPGQPTPRNKLFHWIAQFDGFLVAKFSLYFTDYLGDRFRIHSLRKLHAIDNGYNYINRCVEFYSLSKARFMTIVVRRKIKDRDRVRMKRTVFEYPFSSHYTIPGDSPIAFRLPKSPSTTRLQLDFAKKEYAKAQSTASWFVNHHINLKSASSKKIYKKKRNWTVYGDQLEGDIFMVLIYEGVNEYATEISPLEFIRNLSKEFQCFDLAVWLNNPPW